MKPTPARRYIAQQPADTDHNLRAQNYIGSRLILGGEIQEYGPKYSH